MIGRARHFWTDNDDNVLVDILGELVARGAPKGFEGRPTHWSLIAHNLTDRWGGGVKITNNDVGGRLRHLKWKWHVVADMIAENGFTWDAETHKVLAEDHVWIAYVAVSHLYTC